MMKMKESIKSGVAIILAIAAIMSFAACGKTTSDGTAHTTTTSETAHTSTPERQVEEDTYVEIDLRLPEEEVQKQLCDLLPEDGEIRISDELIVSRMNGSFYLETAEGPYMQEYLGSSDVPALYHGWDWEGEHSVHHSYKGNSYVLIDDLLYCWADQKKLWDVSIPGYEDWASLHIENVDNDIVVIHDATNHKVYVAYDGRIRMLGENVYDVDAQYDDLWWLTIEGHVYKLEDYAYNPQGKAELMATDAIALSNNQSDGPGWYVAGEASYADDWSPVVGKFVPDR